MGTARTSTAQKNCDKTRRVRVADGHKHRMHENRMQCMPGEEAWLVGEHRSTGEQKYTVSKLAGRHELEEARRHDQSQMDL